MSRYLTTLGIVIKRNVYRESDLVITLLTPTLGKIVTIAKGARNIKSTRLSHLQLGNTIKAHLYQKDNRFWLTEGVSTVNFLNSPKNLSQLNLLFYFLELINRVIAENQQIDQIFSISSNLISAINTHQAKDYIQNEIALISVLGFGLPDVIIELFKSQHYRSCQSHINRFLETITEKPFESNKLFK
jgi:DNA repair protein RecO